MIILSYVDSDGINDENERDYKVIKYAATNEFEDFTSGHITPLRSRRSA